MLDDLKESVRPAKRIRLEEDAAAVADISHKTAQLISPASLAIAPAHATEIEREARACITKYVCPNNLGFTGILKQRYTDFMVNEIDLDGHVLHLQTIGTVVTKLTRGSKHDEAPSNDSSREVPSALGAADLPVNPIPSRNSTSNELTNSSYDGTGLVQEGVSAQTLPHEQTVKAEPQAEAFVEASVVDGLHEVEQLSSADRSTLYGIFGEDTTSQILMLVRQISRREDKKAKDFKVVKTLPIIDKETRTQAHRCLRRIFPDVLESTMDHDQSIRIRAAPPADRKGRNKRKAGVDSRTDPEAARSRGQSMWEELGGEFLHFNLYKENKDTMEVIGFLGSKLNCGSKGFGFAGTKDRRACTVQRVCIKRQTAERMQAFNKILFNAAIGDFEYKQSNLKLGALHGNEFTITLRDCHFQNEDSMDIHQRYKHANNVVARAIADFSEKGFLNYYGLQRFGSFATSTDDIGRKMLQNDLKGAVEDLLAFNDIALQADDREGHDKTLVSQDDRNRAKALHLWRMQGSSSKALEILPRKFTAERNIIQHLGSRNSKTGRHDRTTDWQGALMTIPRTLRLMYVHAYQSLIWNAAASRRWAEYGDKVVEGDLVLVKEHSINEAQDHEQPTTDHDQNGEVVINPMGAENANAAESEYEQARALTHVQASSGNYSICDIVLPQPGYDVDYPKNRIGQFYQDFMASERGGGLDPHSMRRSWREISLSGSYRKLISKPLQPLSFEVHQYARLDQQFVKTDLERLKNQVDARTDVEMPDGDLQGAQGAVESDQKLAVVLKLQLGSSQYATMALRELMKAGGLKTFMPEFMGGR